VNTLLTGFISDGVQSRYSLQSHLVIFLVVLS